MITIQVLETIRSKAPFISEGAISTFQVGSMGKRERREYNQNVNKRFEAEAEFKEQNKTTEQKEQEKRKREQREKEGKIAQIKAQIRFLKDFKQVKSKRKNGLKTTYENYIKELEGLKNGT